MEIRSPSRVALVHCPDYDEQAVHEAVGRGLDLLGGVESFVHSGERILLKPNLLAASRPESLVTTHPAVFKAVARHLLDAGASLQYGDSPGFGRTMAVARKAGLVTVAEDLGIPLAEFSQGRTVSFPEGRLVKQFTLAHGALDADGIVSLPKLKTHGLMRLTGAVKNQFGCIPGILKGEFHARMNTDERFGQMLVDLTRFLQPRLYVMDAVVAMQGNGPRSGDPCPMSVLLLSADPVALDATACRLVALDPGLVPTVSNGDAWNLGVASPVELVGDPADWFLSPDFVVDRTPGSTTGEQGRFGRATRDYVVARPVIIETRCTACGTCVKVCPVSPKAVDFGSDGGPATVGRHHRKPPIHHYERCIRCYCCQEMCPEHAIEIRRPFLGRVLHFRTA